MTHTLPNERGLQPTQKGCPLLSGGERRREKAPEAEKGRKVVHVTPEDEKLSTDLRADLCREGRLQIQAGGRERRPLQLCIDSSPLRLRIRTKPERQPQNTSLERNVDDTGRKVTAPVPTLLAILCPSFHVLTTASSPLQRKKQQGGGREGGQASEGKKR